MRPIMKTFALFGQMLEKEHVHFNRELEFGDICRMLKVSPADLNEILLEETGFSGEEILENYRKIDKVY